LTCSPLQLVAVLCSAGGKKTGASFIKERGADVSPIELAHGLPEDMPHQGFAPKCVSQLLADALRRRPIDVEVALEGTGCLVAVEARDSGNREALCNAGLAEILQELRSGVQLRKELREEVGSRAQLETTS
jgi:hypothetical protein